MTWRPTDLQNPYNPNRVGAVFNQPDRQPRKMDRNRGRENTGQEAVVKRPLVGGESGWGGIRTHGRLPYAGFQDQCLRPLGHPSGNVFSKTQINRSGSSTPCHAATSPLLTPQTKLGKTANNTRHGFSLCSRSLGCQSSLRLSCGNRRFPESPFSSSETHSLFDLPQCAIIGIG